LTDEELRRISDGIAPELVPPPNDGPDVCPMCRSWRPETDPLCWNCTQVHQQLSRPCTTVIPISLYCKPSTMRDRLTLYKDGDDYQRQTYAPLIAAIMERFFLEHGDALTEVIGGWETTTVVPSAHRQPPHPLGVALEALPTRRLHPASMLLRRGPGALNHNTMSDDAFLATEDPRGSRVLVLDDVYTTGATAQSAASALQLAGAQVCAVVVVARRVNPQYKPEIRALWERQTALPFRFPDYPWWRTTA
jgi:predicted amidophosphoribosyltransferase